MAADQPAVLTCDGPVALAIALYPESGPALMQQICTIVLGAVTDSEFDEELIGGSDAAKDLPDNSVFAVLGKSAELVSVQIRVRFIVGILIQVCFQVA